MMRRGSSSIRWMARAISLPLGVLWYLTAGVVAVSALLTLPIVMRIMNTRWDWLNAIITVPLVPVFFVLYVLEDVGTYLHNVAHEGSIYHTSIRDGKLVKRLIRLC